MSPFALLDTAQLQRLKSDLVSHIPGDPTWTAAAGVLLRALVDAELRDEDRVARDEEAAEDAKAAQEAKDAAALKEEGQPAQRAENASGPVAAPPASRLSDADLAAMRDRYDREMNERSREAQTKEVA